MNIFTAPLYYQFNHLEIFDEKWKLLAVVISNYTDFAKCECFIGDNPQRVTGKQICTHKLHLIKFYY
jgi:hypothetical protein